MGLLVSVAVNVPQTTVHPRGPVVRMQIMVLAQPMRTAKAVCATIPAMPVAVTIYLMVNLVSEPVNVYRCTAIPQRNVAKTLLAAHVRPMMIAQKVTAISPPLLVSQPIKPMKQLVSEPANAQVSSVTPKELVERMLLAEIALLTVTAHLRCVTQWRGNAFQSTKSMASHVSKPANVEAINVSITNVD